MSTPYAFLDSPTPIAFAHRGGATSDSENVAALFEQVQRLGYRYVETDVRTTADGVPVVFHDADVGRLTGRRARLGSLTMAEVRALTLRGGDPIPTLADVLAAFPDLRFNLDLKDDGAVLAVGPVLRRAAALGRVCVTSFSERRITRARRALGPGVCTGLGVAGVARLAATGRSGAAAVAQLPWRPPGGPVVLRRLLTAARRAGVAVHVWTLNDAPAIRAALDLGVDGIMTDRPELLRHELAQRGLWPG